MITWEEVKNACKGTSFNPSTILYRVREQNMSLEDALSKPLRRSPYLGDDGMYHGINNDAYQTVGLLAAAYNLPENVVRSRMHLGWPMEKILTTPAKKKTNFFQKAIESGINPYTAWGRVHRLNFSEDDALNTPVKKRTNRVEQLRSEDGLFHGLYGDTYETFGDLAESYGKTRDCLFSRLIENRWPYEKALLEPSVPKAKPTHGADGTLYPSKTKAFAASGISKSGFQYRKNVNGMSDSEAIALKDRRKKATLDMNGVLHESQIDALKANGLSKGTFGVRLFSGMDREKAMLGINYARQELVVSDTEKYASHSEAARINHLTLNTLNWRLSAGWNPWEALHIPPNMSLGEYRVCNTLDELGVTYIHDKTIKKTFELLGYSQQEYKSFMNAYLEELHKIGCDVSMTRLAKLRYDFSLINEGNRIFAFIEVDGEQHFRFIPAFFKCIEMFMDRHRRDDIKSSLSEVTGIPLLRIRYDQIDKDTVRAMIEDLLSNPQKYVSSHNRFLDYDEYYKEFSDNFENLSMAVA